MTASVASASLPTGFFYGKMRTAHHISLSLQAITFVLARCVFLWSRGQSLGHKVTPKITVTQSTTLQAFISLNAVDHPRDLARDLPTTWAVGMCRSLIRLIDSSRPRPHWLDATPHRPVGRRVQPVLAWPWAVNQTDVGTEHFDYSRDPPCSSLNAGSCWDRGVSHLSAVLPTSVNSSTCITVVVWTNPAAV